MRFTSSDADNSTMLGTKIVSIELTRSESKAMQMPEKFRGRWNGRITDITVAPHDGVIVIDENTVASTYYMVQKTRRGEFSFLSVTDDRIVLKEDCDSFHGLLELYIDATNNLRLEFGQFQAA